MDDAIGKIFIQDYFQVSTSSVDSQYTDTTASSHAITDESLSLSFVRFQRKFKRAMALLNICNLRRLAWGSDNDDQEKVELTAAELQSLQSELADLEERETHLKARLEYIDEVLKSARLSGYLHIRTRWAALPGEPPPIDENEVDDWQPRFVVLHGSYLFFFLFSTVLSPLDTVLLSDAVELCSLPSFTRKDEETRYSFYILTCHGLRIECSSVSKIQVDGWLKALQMDCCKLGHGESAMNT